jgi:hypothetical protein
MAHTVYLDASMSDDQRRAALYDGDLFVYGQRRSVAALAEFARDMIRKAFGDRDPEYAQFDMPVDAYASLLGALKPAFIHHPESKRLLRELLVDSGCDPELTYFDVPKLRSSTSDGYLTTGIAYAWHPHRDTWYSAPSCQINWWLPVFDIASDNAMAFHPNYWNRPVANTSAGYNYYLWNKLHRGAHVAAATKVDTRPLPRATEALDLEPQTRLICPVGGMLLFSGAQLHSSVPNTSGRTRFSIDFRVVHRGDAVRRAGAPSVDDHCTGTTMRDYLRCTDLARLPEDVVALYDDGTAEAGGALVYGSAA